MNHTRSARNAKPVRCRETGRRYGSLCRAAAEMGLTNTQIGDHLRGRSPSVKGYTFEWVKERRPTSGEGDPYLRGHEAAEDGWQRDENPYSGGDYAELWTLGFDESTAERSAA